MNNYERYEAKYTQYAIDVLEGRVKACKYIQLACKRYLNFFDKYDFRPDKVERVINFIGKLKHFVGKHNGEHFKLLPYQEWIVYSIFGFYHPESKIRVTNYVYCELARKNGKTAFIMAICLYMLIAVGENGSEVE